MSVVSAIRRATLPEPQSQNRTWRPPPRPKRDDFETWKHTTKVSLWERQLMRCYYCGDALGNVSASNLEHLVPVLYGGGVHPANLVLACSTCNSLKGASSEEEFINFLILKEQDDGVRPLPTPEGFREDLPLDPEALVSNLR